MFLYIYYLCLFEEGAVICIYIHNLFAATKEVIRVPCFLADVAQWVVCTRLNIKSMIASFKIGMRTLKFNAFGGPQRKGMLKSVHPAEIF